MDFVAIDVETANPDLSSIRQVGIACFTGGELRDSCESLVRSGHHFDSCQVSIYGNDEDDVAAQFGIQYRPHDAIEVARCADEIVSRAYTTS